TLRRQESVRPSIVREGTDSGVRKQAVRSPDKLPPNLDPCPRSTDPQAKKTSRDRRCRLAATIRSPVRLRTSRQAFRGSAANAKHADGLQGSRRNQPLRVPPRPAPVEMARTGCVPSSSRPGGRHSPTLRSRWKPFRHERVRRPFYSATPPTPRAVVPCEACGMRRRLLPPAARIRLAVPSLRCTQPSPEEIPI